MKPMRVLVVLSAALILSGCAAEKPPAEGTADATREYPTAERPLDSLSLIEQAMSVGDIDYSTALLYKVYVMFDPMSLPPEYESDLPAKCGTPLILEVQRNWHRLAPEHRVEIESYIQPISDPDGTDTQLDDVTRDRLDHEQNRLD